MKECIKCKEAKPYTEFFKRKDAKDGYQYACKLCQKPRSHGPVKTHRSGRTPVDDLTTEDRKRV